MPAQLPRLIAEATAHAPLLGPLEHHADDLGPLWVEAQLAAVSELDRSFAHVLQRLMESVDRDPQALEAAITLCAGSYDLILGQMVWAQDRMAIGPFLRHLKLGHVLFPVLIKLVKRRDAALTDESSRRWLEARHAFGTRAAKFLDNAIARLGPRRDGIATSLRIYHAATRIDYVALPRLASAAARPEAVEEATLELRRAIDSLRLIESPNEREEVHYWRCTGHRHLAMAEIKAGNPTKALLQLAISSVYARQVQDRLEEVMPKLWRGYAEVQLVFGQREVAHRFLSGTAFQVDTLARYVPRDKVRMSCLPDARLHLLLVRHCQRESDAHREFGFTGNVTTRGQSEFGYLARRLKAMLGERTNLGQVYVVCDDLLLEEAQDLFRLVRDQEGVGGETMFDSSVHWRPIDVGAFRGLTEIEAQNRYPGTYRALLEYRHGMRDGYDLEFPEGESVRVFDERISRALAEVLERYALDSGEEEAQAVLSSRPVVVFGHTSTLTAVLNLVQDWVGPHARRPCYRYEPIETGTIVETVLRLDRCDQRSEMYRLLGGYEMAQP